MTDGTVKVGVAPPERRIHALGMLLPGVDPAERPRVATELLAGAEVRALAGLLEARRGDRTVGAVWAQTQPGATAVLWPPVVTAAAARTAHVLLLAACRFLERQQVVIAQSLLETASRQQAAQLESADFVFMAELVYLACTESYFPASLPAGQLEFEAYGQDNHARLSQVVRRTYAETLDCPRLGGLRKIDDILAGYRATGQFDPALWMIARHRGGDVGCLLLADHPQLGNLELVYMGVVPEARGNGFGDAMARHAQWLARVRGRPRLVLAADRQNRPALAIYEAAGFVGWETRGVWMRSFTGAQLNSGAHSS